MNCPRFLPRLTLFTVIFALVGCANPFSPALPMATVPAEPVQVTPTRTPRPTLSPQPLPSTSTSIPLGVTEESPTLPQDQYSRSDQFGDGYIAKVKVDEVKGKAPEDVVIILVTQWLEHYKQESSEPAAAIDDYTIDGIRMLDNLPDGTYVFVAGVNFSIIPKEPHNAYGSFPGKPRDPNSPWDVIGAPFGVIQVDDYYYLRLVFGWGT